MAIDQSTSELISVTLIFIQEEKLKTSTKQL